ncbi:hypothetical protein CBLAS_0176 [Campylobacter blaseri]|uniref:Periplasmic protein n=1 Tax=Campylobacter blaseri TaxID=2042961 RepID=A0A2P8R106_9BACT|nr:hypothetical protein [Campylobacter blaseri]PSM52183.1 hypothetical protein CQ405_03780 [Campylobacter blaseri]PSM53949.1 hypothetical protein CRN67_03780 [Campylobacter blaseri]QKF85386.1 hypothetical protein CBLAS_0176 [Campylobacter blaseri]
MVRTFYLGLIFSISLFGASAEQIASNLGGNSIGMENLTDENGNPNIDLITKKLQEDGSLNLLSNEKVNIKLTFDSNGNGSILIKSIKDSLFNLGYFDYENIEFENSDNSSYSIIVKASKIPDPGEIYKELKKSNIFITDAIKSSKTSYKYTLNTKESNLYGPTFGSEYKKPIKPYFINIKDKKSISISVQQGDIWHPKIRIYDSNLKLIEEKNINEPRQSLNVNLPEGANYIQVDDASSLDNIKQGLKFSL